MRSNTEAWEESWKAKVLMWIHVCAILQYTIFYASISFKNSLTMKTMQIMQQAKSTNYYYYHYDPLATLIRTNSANMKRRCFPRLIRNRWNRMQRSLWRVWSTYWILKLFLQSFTWTERIHHRSLRNLRHFFWAVRVHKVKSNALRGVMGRKQQTVPDQHGGRRVKEQLFWWKEAELDIDPAWCYNEK